MPARKDKGGTVPTRHGWQARCGCGALSRETFVGRRARMVTYDGFVLHDGRVKCPACAITVRACDDNGTLRQNVNAAIQRHHEHTEGWTHASYSFDYAAYGARFRVTVFERVREYEPGDVEGLEVTPRGTYDGIPARLADLPAPVRAVVRDVRAIMRSEPTQADKRREARWAKREADWEREDAEWTVKLAKLDAQVADGKARAVKRAAQEALDRATDAADKASHALSDAQHDAMVAANSEVLVRYRAWCVERRKAARGTP